jgi:hypothetical protein
VGAASEDCARGCGGGFRWAFGLQPHRPEACKLCKDPLFIGKVRDVIGRYVDPPERDAVLCVKEKSQILESIAR